MYAVREGEAVSRERGYVVALSTMLITVSVISIWRGRTSHDALALVETLQSQVIERDAEITALRLELAGAGWWGCAVSGEEKPAPAWLKVGAEVYVRQHEGNYDGCLAPATVTGWAETDSLKPGNLLPRAYVDNCVELAAALDKSAACIQGLRHVLFARSSVVSSDATAHENEIRALLRRVRGEGAR